MKHFTNKTTNDVWGYESLEEAKELNQDFENLVEMDEKTFLHFRDEKPKGGKWTWDKGWVIDQTLFDEEDLYETEYELQDLESQKNEMIAEMQKNFLLGKEDKARSSAQEMDDLDRRIDELREKISKLKEKLDK